MIHVTQARSEQLAARSGHYDYFAYAMQGVENLLLSWGLDLSSFHYDGRREGRQSLGVFYADERVGTLTLQWEPSGNKLAFDFCIKGQYVSSVTG